MNQLVRSSSIQTQVRAHVDVATGRASHAMWAALPWIPLLRGYDTLPVGTKDSFPIHITK